MTKSNGGTRLISLVMSFVFLFSFVGCTHRNRSVIPESETLSATPTPALERVVTDGEDNDEINSLEDIDKLEQIISVEEVELTQYYYEEYSENIKYYLGVSEAKDDKFNYKIMYKSDDFEVAGYISAPADYLERSYPILIFNRGGMHYNGKVTPGILSFLADLGFIVIATQYRGIDGGTGKDELGGADVQDVISLIDIAEQLPFGSGKIYMQGVSRGGIETYRVIKEENLAGRNRISAAVVLSGVSDLRAYYNMCLPKWKDMVGLYVGGTPEEVPEEYEKRSAVCWPEMINIPLLICHGESDENVSVEQAKTMYKLLREQDKEVELRLYDGGHIVNVESNEYLVEWLRSH